MAGLDDFPELPSDADDDEALRYAIALSLRESQGDSAQKPKDGSENNPTELDSSANKDKVDEKNKATFGSIALDRKAMEEERLKRLAAKRPRPTEDDDDDVVEVAPPAKRPTPVPASRPSTQKAPASMSGLSTTGGQGSKPTAPVSSFRSTAKRGALLQFPDGAVKKTWAYGHPRTDEDIKIEEVLQKDQLELAVLSSFQWDDEWLMSKFDIPRTKLLLVAYAAGQEQVRIST